MKLLIVIEEYALTANLARPPAESRHGGLYILLLFLVYFLTIFVRPLLSQNQTDRPLPNFQVW